MHLSFSAETFHILEWILELMTLNFGNLEEKIFLNPTGVN